MSLKKIINNEKSVLEAMTDGKHRKPALPESVEWPTIFLLFGFWLSFGLLTYFYEYIAWWLLIPLAGYALALFGSLQHEVLHGHPTPWKWLNEALVFPALSLWVPFQLYKESHLIHHNNVNLTDPERDPESFYIAPARWNTFPKWLKQYYRFLNTFTGRFLWGPLHVVAVSLYSEFRTVFKGDTRKMRIWFVHGMSCALVLWWVLGVCGIALWEYLVFFIFPGLALTLVRSFLEHQVASKPDHRSVIVEAGPLMSLMFLNNNLHAVHHSRPGLAWYKLPAIWEESRAEVLARNNGYYFSGYLSIVRRYWKRVKEMPVYGV